MELGFAVFAQSAISKTREPEPEPELPQLPKKRGRPTGKRSDPDYEQVTVYIRQDKHTAVTIALLQQGSQEFSELVEELLTKWLSRWVFNNSIF